MQPDSPHSDGQASADFLVEVAGETYRFPRAPIEAMARDLNGYLDCYVPIEIAAGAVGVLLAALTRDVSGWCASVTETRQQDTEGNLARSRSNLLARAGTPK